MKKDSNYIAKQGKKRRKAMAKPERANVEEMEAEGATVDGIQAEARERARIERNREGHARQKIKRQREGRRGGQRGKGGGVDVLIVRLDS